MLLEHTHKDIDQAFSPDLERPRSENAIILPDPLKGVRSTNDKEARVVYLKPVVYWSKLRKNENIRRIRFFSQCRYLCFSHWHRVRKTTSNWNIAERGGGLCDKWNLPKDTGGLWDG